MQDSRPATGFCRPSLTVMVFGLIYWEMDADIWKKQSDIFFKSNKPYGAGDFRIKGNQVISVKVSEPEIKPNAVALSRGKRKEFGGKGTKRALLFGPMPSGPMLSAASTSRAPAD